MCRKTFLLRLACTKNLNYDSRWNFHGKLLWFKITCIAYEALMWNTISASFWWSRAQFMTISFNGRFDEVLNNFICARSNCGILNKSLENGWSMNISIEIKCKRMFPGMGYILFLIHNLKKIVPGCGKPWKSR